MLSWKEYLEELLNTPTVLDNLSFKHGDNISAVSPIVKASIHMLESMLSTEGLHNIFVFPEIKELLYEFVLAKIVFNVAAGKINILYDPHTFKVGQKLKYKNCVVEFVKCETDKKDGKEKIHISFAEDKYHCKSIFQVPIEFAPIFQIASENVKRLSKPEKFYEVYSVKKTIEELRNISSKQGVIEVLTDYKTHLDGSIFLISNVKQAKEYFDQTVLIKILYTKETVLSC